MDRANGKARKSLAARCEKALKMGEETRITLHQTCTSPSGLRNSISREISIDIVTADRRQITKSELPISAAVTVVPAMTW